MRLLFLRSTLALAAVLAVLSCGDAPTSPDAAVTPEAMASGLAGPLAAASVAYPPVLISQVYGGGGNSGATLTHDFIELFNPGTESVSLAGWSVQYAASTGSNWQRTDLSGSVAPGGYYLVRQAAGNGGSVALPNPDATGSIAMSATTGKVFLLSGTTLLSGTCPTGASIVDRMGFGSTNCGPNTPALSNTTAALRNANGCAYTNDAAADFSVGAPTPRNSASPANSCAAPAEPATVTVEPAAATLEAGGTVALSATARDAADDPVGTSFTWTTSDAAVATVDASGVVTGVATGSAVITATAANGVSGTSTVTVTEPPPPPAVSDIVISQVYGGGGNSGAFYTHDFIELYNRGDEAIDLAGWSVQYTSAAGTSWQVTALSGVIQPGRYVLVQQAAGAAGTAPLPSPDVVGSIPMGATSGKVVLATITSALIGACPSGPLVVDRVGYGANSTTNGCESLWGGRTANLSNTTAALRRNDGCIDTGSGSADFVVLSPSPRNSGSARRYCSQPPREQSEATLLINELMADPANAENASWGQWFEVHNYGTAAIDLQGWTIVTDGTSQPDHLISTSVVVPAGGYAVLGRGADPLRNGGITLAYNYFTGTASTLWLDARDFLMLVDAAGARVDSVAWSSLPRGVAKGLRPGVGSRADVDGPDWAYASTTYGDGDYGTPGAVNAPLVDVAPYVSPNRISVSGRTASDAPLPVGFEAQLFATLLDPANQVVAATFTWSSLTPAVASVDPRGVIRALAPGNATFRVTAEDGTARNHTLVMETPLAGSAQYGNHTEFGDPVDDDPSDDFLIRRTEFTGSWNEARGIPNWVAYNLNATQIVPGQDRCNCFTFDPLLEAVGYSSYTTADYTGAGAFAGYGIDRGHLVRSFDRTSGTLDNARTYYFSNIVPQAADLNQGPWAVHENYLGDLARFQDREVWIYTGATGTQGTVKGEGRITIPEYSWKVSVIASRGTSLADVRDYRDLEVVAVVMPNIPGIRNADWQTEYLVTADSVERLSGYRLLAALPANVQRALKTGTQPPIAIVAGTVTGIEGSPLTLSGASSVDPNGTVVSFYWDLGDGTTATGAEVTHTYAFQGSYTARLVVADNDGLVDTAYVAVDVRQITPEEGIAQLREIIGQLQADGSLNNGNANSMLAKIRSAEQSLGRGQVGAAVNQLQALSNEIDALERSGWLTALQARLLREAVERLIRAISA